MVVHQCTNCQRGSQKVEFSRCHVVRIYFESESAWLDLWQTSIREVRGKEGDKSLGAIDKILASPIGCALQFRRKTSPLKLSASVERTIVSVPSSKVGGSWGVKARFQATFGKAVRRPGYGPENAYAACSTHVLYAAFVFAFSSFGQPEQLQTVWGDSLLEGLARRSHVQSKGHGVVVVSEVGTALIDVLARCVTVLAQWCRPVPTADQSHE
ncbi:hypothetical protein BJY52DRAFT_1361689 [Lactarius psammicola]|nr:hypothetical protein BJY52DRAFT_1361689 [Lactarius psammicola]